MKRKYYSTDNKLDKLQEDLAEKAVIKLGSAILAVIMIAFLLTWLLS